MAFENQSEHDLLAFTLHLYKACVFSSSATTISFPSFNHILPKFSHGLPLEFGCIQGLQRL